MRRIRMQAITDLSKNVGLPIRIKADDLSLIFDDESLKVEPAVRTIDQMKEVLLDKSIEKPLELYYMYRDVALSGDRDNIQKNNLRFDITVIKPDHLGKEYMKTAGHYHPGIFPELYEVVYGRAWCVLQRRSKEDFKKIIDVIVVEAKQGDKIVCLPDYGHILINPSKDEPLITANWVSSRFSSEYTLYKKAGGAAYFFLDDNGQTRILKNDTFVELSDIGRMRCSSKIDKFGLESGAPMYNLIKKDPKKIEFLNHPERFDYKDAFIEEK